MNKSARVPLVHSQKTDKSTPIAPPVYRPQPVPRVLQTKMAPAQPPNQPKRTPVAPPVYRPQPTPKVLQKKTAAGGRQQVNAQLRAKTGVAPVHNPQPPRKLSQPNKVVQAKLSGRLPRVTVSAPPIAASSRCDARFVKAPMVNKTMRFGAIQRKRFQYNGGAYDGIDPAECQPFMTGQEDPRTCWAAVLSNAQGLLGEMPRPEGQIIEWANERLGRGTTDDMTYLIADGANPSSYQEIINILKERTGINTQSVPWSADNLERIFAHVVREKPVIIGNEADDPHVVILLAVGTASNGQAGVLFYDTQGGHFREASHRTFQSNNLKTAFLMDKWSSGRR